MQIHWSSTLLKDKRVRELRFVHHLSLSELKSLFEFAVKSNLQSNKKFYPIHLKVYSFVFK